MANYSLVIGSKFSPFTYEELLKAPIMATQAHRELEDQYSELATKTNVWEDIANEETDHYAYQMYKRYSDDLKAQADILATQGLTPSSRKAMLNMKDRYSKEITPIETAYNKREELIKQQRDALLKDSTLIFDRDYGTTNLEYLMRNPNATFTPLSGEGIAKRTAVMAKEAASAVLSDPEYTPVFNSQYVQQKIQQGYDMSQVIAAAQRDPNAPKALLGIVDAIKGEVGYEDWSVDNRKKIDSYINEGLRAAIGTPKIDVMSNRNYMSEMDRERLELTREEFEWRKEQEKGIKQPDGSYYKPLGGGRILYTKPDGTSIIIGAPEDNIEEDKELNEKLSEITKVSGMKGKGYVPIGVVAKAGGYWRHGRAGEDIGQEDITGDSELDNGVLLGFTRTNLRNRWGNYKYSSLDPNAETTIVTRPESIPGFKEEYLKGTAESIDRDSAFGHILLTLEREGISIDEAFNSNNVQILQVKGRGSRKKSDTPYDYIIYRKP